MNGKVYLSMMDGWVSLEVSLKLPGEINMACDIIPELAAGGCL